ncbi:unnamed protein product [Bathycoccus prasinos]
MPWAGSIFDINQDTMRACQIGNGNVVPVINSDAAVEVNDIPLNVYSRRTREWAVNSKPWFLAAKCIEAAKVLKPERIKLPADANIEEDDMLFPTVCLARLNRGRNVQEVAAAPRGRRRINRIFRYFCNPELLKILKLRFRSQMML